MFLLIERNLTLLEAELLNSGGHLYCDVDIPRHSPYDNHYKLLLHLRLGVLFCKETKG